MKIKQSTIAPWIVTGLTLLFATVASQAQTQNYIVDDFVPAGVSSSNPTNYDYYSSVQNYSSGQLNAVWWNWFGGAFVTNSWDSTSDASNNPSSGSLKISLNFSSANNQFVLWDQGTNNNFFALGLNATTFTNFQCDVRFAPGSASDSGSYGSPIFGHLRFGNRPGNYSQDWFGGVDIAATNTNWVHVSITLNAIADPNLVNMGGLLIGIDRGFYSLNLNGPSTLWVDNIKFVGAGTAVSNPPPTLGLQKSIPALRTFAGSIVNIYDREQLTSVDQNQSWVGGTYPVSYSYTLKSFPSIPPGSVFRYHIFLVPVSFAGGNSFTANEYIEYQASNNLWLNVSATNPTNVVADVSWKTNLPGANPNNTALLITNSTAVGTWTLTFNSATSGALTAPGASPVAFSLPPDAAAQFTNKLVAFFGVQPDSGFGIGQYADVSHIQTLGVASPGVAINDDFTTDTAINTAIWDTSNSAQPSSLVLATTNTPYWVTWTLPDTGFVDANGLGYLAVTANLTTGQWVVPEYYNGYNDGINIPGTTHQGTAAWTLIPSTCLPTVDGQPQTGQALAPNSFFRLYNTPPPAP